MSWANNVDGLPKANNQASDSHLPPLPPLVRYGPVDFPFMQGQSHAGPQRNVMSSSQPQTRNTMTHALSNPMTQGQGYSVGQGQPNLHLINTMTQGQNNSMNRAGLFMAESQGYPMAKSQTSHNAQSQSKAQQVNYINQGQLHSMSQHQGHQTAQMAQGQVTMTQGQYSSINQAGQFRGMTSGQVNLNSQGLGRIPQGHRSTSGQLSMAQGQGQMPFQVQDPAFQRVTENAYLSQQSRGQGQGSYPGFQQQHQGQRVSPTMQGIRHQYQTYGEGAMAGARGGIATQSQPTRFPCPENTRRPSPTGLAPTSVNPQMCQTSGFHSPQGFVGAPSFHQITGFAGTANAGQAQPISTPSPAHTPLPGMYNMTGRSVLNPSPPSYSEYIHRMPMPAHQQLPGTQQFHRPQVPLSQPTDAPTLLMSQTCRAMTHPPTQPVITMSGSVVHHGASFTPASRTPTAQPRLFPQQMDGQQQYRIRNPQAQLGLVIGDLLREKLLSNQSQTQQNNNGTSSFVNKTSDLATQKSVESSRIQMGPTSECSNISSRPSDREMMRNWYTQPVKTTKESGKLIEQMLRSTTTVTTSACTPVTTVADSRNEFVLKPTRCDDEIIEYKVMDLLRFLPKFLRQKSGTKPVVSETPPLPSDAGQPLLEACALIPSSETNKECDNDNENGDQNHAEKTSEDMCENANMISDMLFDKHKKRVFEELTLDGNFGTQDMNPEIDYREYIPGTPRPVISNRQSGDGPASESMEQESLTAETMETGSTITSYPSLEASGTLPSPIPQPIGRDDLHTPTLIGLSNVQSPVTQTDDSVDVTASSPMVTIEMDDVVRAADIVMATPSSPGQKRKFSEDTNQGGQPSKRVRGQASRGQGVKRGSRGRRGSARGRSWSERVGTPKAGLGRARGKRGVTRGLRGRPRGSRSVVSTATISSDLDNSSLKSGQDTSADDSEANMAKLASTLDGALVTNPADLRELVQSIPAQDLSKMSIDLLSLKNFMDLLEKRENPVTSNMNKSRNTENSNVTCEDIVETQEEKITKNKPAKQKLKVKTNSPLKSKAKTKLPLPHKKSPSESKVQTKLTNFMKKMDEDILEKKSIPLEENGDKISCDLEPLAQEIHAGEMDPDDVKTDEKCEFQCDTKLPSEDIQKIKTENVQSGHRSDKSPKKIKTKEKTKMVYISEDKKLYWLRFHGKTVTQLITPEGIFFIMSEIIRRCFRIEGPKKNKTVNRIMFEKRNTLRIPDIPLDPIFYNEVVINLLRRKVIKTQPSHFTVISLDDANRLVHHICGDKFCGKGCVGPWNGSFDKKKSRNPSGESVQSSSSRASLRKQETATATVTTATESCNKQTFNKPQGGAVVVLISDDEDGYRSDTTVPYVDGTPADRMKELQAGVRGVEQSAETGKESNQKLSDLVSVLNNEAIKTGSTNIENTNVSFENMNARVENAVKNVENKNEKPGNTNEDIVKTTEGDLTTDDVFEELDTLTEQVDCGPMEAQVYMDNAEMDMDIDELYPSSNSEGPNTGETNDGNTTARLSGNVDVNVTLPVKPTVKERNLFENVFCNLPEILNSESIRGKPETDISRIDKIATDCKVEESAKPFLESVECNTDLISKHNDSTLTEDEIILLSTDEEEKENGTDKENVEAAQAVSELDNNGDTNDEAACNLKVEQVLSLAPTSDLVSEKVSLTERKSADKQVKSDISKESKSHGESETCPVVLMSEDSDSSQGPIVFAMSDSNHSVRSPNGLAKNNDTCSSAIDQSDVKRPLTLKTRLRTATGDTKVHENDLVCSDDVSIKKVDSGNAYDVGSEEYHSDTNEIDASKSVKTSDAKGIDVLDLNSNTCTSKQHNNLNKSTEQRDNAPDCQRAPDSEARICVDDITDDVSESRESDLPLVDGPSDSESTSGGPNMDKLLKAQQTLKSLMQRVSNTTDNKEMKSIVSEVFELTRPLKQWSTMYIQHNEEDPEDKATSLSLMKKINDRQAMFHPEMIDLEEDDDDDVTIVEERPSITLK